MGIRHIFGAPVFADEEQTRRVWVLHVILWTFLLLGIVAFVANMLILPQHKARWIGLTASFGLISVVLILLNRRGRTRMAAVLLLAVLWLMSVVLALISGGVHSVVSLAWVVYVLVAGLLFGDKAGVIAAIVFSLPGLTFLELEAAGRLPTSRLAHTPLSLWVVQVFLPRARSRFSIFGQSLNQGRPGTRATRVGGYGGKLK